MKERLATYLASARVLWEKLPKAARIGVAIVGVGLLAISGWLVSNSGNGLMEPLYEHPVELAQAAQIREHLETSKVPHKIMSNGSILVPSDRKLELRMELASEGLQPASASGFELFDDQRFGASEFEQRVNFRRALEGELARTIRTIKAVDSVRVHLNLPRRSLFREEDTHPSASVVLGLERGAMLTGKRVVGIQELVARSVERLQPDRVAVLDDQGRMLSQDQEDAGGAMALDYQRRYEQQLEQRVEEILERTIGEGHAAVRVAAEFDFSRMEETQEHYDPDRSVIRSEQLVRESEGDGAEQAGGVPGVRSNLPGGPGPQTSKSGANSSRSSETRNYEVDKVVRRVLSPVARLKRQSVAVLVDGRWETMEGAGESSAEEEGTTPGEKVFVPREEEEINRIASLVKRAVGFNEERGDEVDVQSMPFADNGQIADEQLPTPPAAAWPWWGIWAIAAAVAAVGLMALLLVIRRRRKNAQKEQEENLPKTVKEIEAELEGVHAEPGLEGPGLDDGQPALPGTVSIEDSIESIRLEALNLASQDTEAAARVIRTWLAEESQSTVSNEA